MACNGQMVPLRKRKGMDVGSMSSRTVCSLLKYPQHAAQEMAYAEKGQQEEQQYGKIPDRQ